eukprot:TRINITY_DN16352_c0_g2_i1.p1 TRINITY_DN16352_c0_g2~~TRINITY_DN16352_c0_g2_i1.p1  ORF type:complete len:620 (+),score=106.76 TRINITY_DN16352_c0_g2_i1:31-1890(+)
MDVQWRDLAFDAAGKRILQPCSGSLGPGCMVALMGGSGSGKTTLLSCLRRDRPHSGLIHFDGKPFTPQVRQSIGFVEQEDVVISAMTVRASLQFLAELHFGAGSPEATTRVANLLEEFRLKGAGDTVIGDQDAPEKISGGQRKRLCIARELLSNPRLLLCDEPTSGLDSTMAEQVVESMRQLCDAKEVSVMASIHQPSTRIFEQFDYLILLHEGHMVYSGPTSGAEALFKAHGPARAPMQSLSEYVMDCLVLEHDPPFRFAELAAQARKEAAKLPALEPTKGSRSHGIMVPWSDRRAPFLRQLAVLFRRHVRLVYGSMFTRQNVLLNLGLVMIAALLWWRLGFAVEDIEPRFAATCWTVGTWMFLPIFGGTGTFGAEEAMVSKELKAQSYALPSYYLARTLMMLPLELVWPTLWVTGVFWMTNQNPSPLVFLKVLSLVWLTFACFQAVGLMIAASGLPPGSAATLAVLIITYFFGWTKLLMDLRRVPIWLHWAADANIFNKAVDMVFSIVVEDLEFACGSADNLAQAKLGCEDGVVTGAEARERLGISSAPLTCMWILLSCCIVFRIVAYILLRFHFREAIDGSKAFASQGAFGVGSKAGATGQRCVVHQETESEDFSV